MTIYKKGWFDEIKPALDSIGDSVVHLMNPNYDSQQTLKKLIAQNPEMAQKLANMGPDAVEKLFGKEMRKYAEALPQDIETITTNAVRPTLPGMIQQNLPELGENALKIDPTGRQNKKAIATINTEQAKVAPQVSQAAGIQATDQIEASHRTAAARAVVEGAKKRLGSTSLAQAFKKGMLTPSEKSAIFQDENATKEVKTEIDTDFEQKRLNLAEYDSQTSRMNAISSRMNAERERISGTPEGIMLNAQTEIAKHIAERSGNPALFGALMEIQKNPTLQTQLEKAPEPPKGTPQHMVWEAAQATKDYKDGLTTDIKSKRVGAFMTKTSALFKIANDHKKSKEERSAAVRNINVIGASMFGEFGEDRPVVSFDEGVGLFSKEHLKPNGSPRREPGVVISGDSEITSMITTADPSLGVGTTADERQQINQGLQMWKTASIEQVRASLAKLPPDKQEKMKALLSGAGIKY